MDILRWPKAMRIILCFLLLVVLGWLLFVFRVDIGNLLIPWLKLVVSVIETRFDVAELNIVRNKTEYVYHLRLSSDHPVELYGHLLPGMDVSATTLVSHSLQQIFILLATLVISALFVNRTKPARLLALITIFLLIAVAVDIPFVLLGSIDGLILQNLAPEQLNTHWLVQWERFMNNGGRISFAIMLSTLIIWIL